MTDLYILEAKARNNTVTDIEHTEALDQYLAALNQQEIKLNTHQPEPFPIKVYTIVGNVAAQATGLDIWTLHHIPTGTRIGYYKAPRATLDTMLPTLSAVMAIVPEDLETAKKNRKTARQMRELHDQVLDLGIVTG